MKKVLIAVVLAATALAGCQDQMDRGGGIDIGSTTDDFDDIVDAEEVVLVRNSNGYPNFVLICHDGYAYVATRSVNGGNGGVSRMLFPDPQRREDCVK